MRVSLKAKLTVLISVLVLVVVVATSTLYVASLTRQALEEVQTKGEYVANETYSQARAILAQSRMPAGVKPTDFEAVRSFVRSKLATDKNLDSVMQSAVGYMYTIAYVTITDMQNVALVHTDPGEVGRPFASAPRFSELLHAGLFRQLRVIYGPVQVYEVVLRLEMSGQPLCDVRVGVSTALLAGQVITPQLRTALEHALVVILLATLSAGLLSFRLLRPLETISQNVDRMARGEFSKPVELNRTDEWGILSSKLNLLGEQIRGEKAAFVALKENLDQLFSNLADGLLLFDNQDRLALATPAVSRFLGRSPEKLVHRPAAEIFSGESPLDRLLREAFRTRKSLSWHMVNLAADAEAPRVSVGVQFVEAQDQSVASLVTLRDASTRAQLEDQLDITAKLAALGRLTSGVAHEVKNPLNAMVLQLEILKSKLEGHVEQVKPQLEILSSEIRRLDRVVRTFLDFTRPVELHPTDTDIESLVREVFTLAEPHAQKGNVQLLLEPNGALPPVRLDRDLIKQALLNLVLNGCQAMPSGGQLKVSPHSLPHGVELEITDQGVGIPPEARQKIFSLYFTTKPNGSGVGLAMAYRIIQLHNGSLDFSSEVNRGTTFRVSLPR